MATSTLDRFVSGRPSALLGAKAASTKYTSTGMRLRIPRSIVCSTPTSKLAAKTGGLVVELAGAHRSRQEPRDLAKDCVAALIEPRPDLRQPEWSQILGIETLSAARQQ